MKSGKILLGLLVGLTAGVTLGILFAPEEGASTRNKISKKSDEYAKELEEKFSQFIDSLVTKYESVKDEASHLGKKIKRKAESVELPVWETDKSV